MCTRADKSLENGYVAVQSARHLFKSYEGLVEDVRGGEPGAEGGSEEEVRIALFGVVPALIKRMSAKRTPKELKREVCKTLLCVARGGKINGLDLIVPFLNSPKVRGGGWGGGWSTRERRAAPKPLHARAQLIFRATLNLRWRANCERRAAPKPLHARA
jgi:hypothetical protein